VGDDLLALVEVAEHDDAVAEGRLRRRDAAWSSSSDASR
jgi:hypothetical protein